MEKDVKICDLKTLLEWIEENSRCYISEQDKDYFCIEAPNNADVYVGFVKGGDVHSLVDETITSLKDFDADELFTELWNYEFAKHNCFTPLQFITMLKKDEETFRNLAHKLDAHRQAS